MKKYFIYLAIGVCLLLILIGSQSCGHLKLDSKRLSKIQDRNPQLIAGKCAALYPIKAGIPTIDSSAYLASKITIDSLIDVISAYEDILDNIEPVYKTDTVTKECEPYKVSEKNYERIIADYKKKVALLAERLADVKPIEISVPYEDSAKIFLLAHRVNDLLTQKDKLSSSKSFWQTFSIWVIIGLVLSVIGNILQFKKVL
mgnify:FL=1